jgi:hypothetical protein
VIAEAQIVEVEAMNEIWQRDPIGFFVDVLDVHPDHVWDKMREIAESVRDNPFTVVPAGHSVSKSYTAARLCVWFMMSFPPATVITTAPTATIVEEVIWREIRTSVDNAKLHLGGKLLTSKWDFQEETGQKWYALGFATKPDTITREATAFQGYHNKHVFILFDEAAGVPSEIWRAADSLFTDDFVRMLAIGNPTALQGEFARVVNDPNWNVINVSVTDTPNFKTGRRIIPGVAGRDFERRYRERYGVDSREYKVRVLGQFADYAVDGAYYAPILRDLKNRGRFSVEFHPSYPVHTVWDNGYTTSIWFFQEVGQNINIIRFYQDQGPGIEEYIDVLRRLKDKHGYRYGSHFAPFDVDNNSQRSVTGETIRETAENLGFHFTALQREGSVIDGIERTRKFLRSCWFNETDCQIGIEFLMKYHERQNYAMSTADHPVFTGIPAKDGCDHPADALRYMSKAVQGDLVHRRRSLTLKDIEKLQRAHGLL